MLEELRASPRLFQPSAFWEGFNELNLKQLDEHGFQNFKRTLARNYFSFVAPSGLGDPQFKAVVRHLLEHPAPRVLAARIADPGDAGGEGDAAWRRRLRLHAVYVAGLWEVARRRDSIGLLDRLVEPSLGNPLLVRHRGRLITEDLCNSALELLAVLEGLPGGRPGPGPIVEVGGGYGRLAWAFLEAFPGLRYVLVDIPPALAVAERYLTALYPDRPVFGFRRFARPEDVAEELAAAQIAFLTPNQLDMLPSLGAAGVVNVSSLHEMRRDQIAYYLQELIPRHAPGGFFYTKQWKRSENSRDGIVVRREDYPVPESWERVYERTHPIQVEFFEALYRVRGEPAGLPAADPVAAASAEPTLSICIPTHGARATELRELLDIIEEQARPGLEVCVSDNASLDGTAAVVAAFRERTGIPTVYRRNPTNMGVGANIVSAAELASGDYCWLMGSDDHLAPDAIATIFGLLANHPGVSGVTTRRENFSADMREHLDPDRAAFYPDAPGTALLSGSHEVMSSLGQAFAFLGIHVVHRERFLRMARDGAAGARVHSLWPQVFLFGLMALRDPRWVWCPTPLVHARAYRSYIGDTREAGSNLGSIHAHVVTTLGDVWRDLMPRGFGVVRRTLIQRAFQVWAAPDQVAIIKRRTDQTLAADWRMLVAFTRRFWRVPEYWRQVFPALLVPYPVARVADRLLAKRRPASEPLPRRSLRAGVSAGPPAVVAARSMIQVPARITNTGDARFVSSPPCPVNISYQWFGPDGKEVLEGLRTELRRPLAPGASVQLTLRLLTPWDPGVYRLRISPVQENVAWFADVDPASAVELTVRAVTHDEL